MYRVCRGRLRPCLRLLLPSLYMAQATSVPLRIKPLGPDVPEQESEYENRRAYARDRHPL